MSKPKRGQGGKKKKKKKWRVEVEMVSNWTFLSL